MHAVEYRKDYAPTILQCSVSWSCLILKLMNIGIAMLFYKGDLWVDQRVVSVMEGQQCHDGRHERYKEGNKRRLTLDRMLGMLLIRGRETHWVRIVPYFEQVLCAWWAFQPLLEKCQPIVLGCNYGVCGQLITDTSKSWKLLENDRVTNRIYWPFVKTSGIWERRADRDSEMSWNLVDYRLDRGVCGFNIINYSAFRL